MSRENIREFISHIWIWIAAGAVIVAFSFLLRYREIRSFYDAAVIRSMIAENPDISDDELHSLIWAVRQSKPMKVGKELDLGVWKDKGGWHAVKR